jgi:lysophospholipase L1-like esterase
VYDSHSRRVVCLGDSIVRGQVSTNFVNLLNQRMHKHGFHFVNAGVNGDLAYNVLIRLNTVVDKQPDFIIILVGTNDVVGALVSRMAKQYRRVKKLPQLPTEQWYCDNILKIVHYLKENTRAKIALASLPVLGENLTSTFNKTINTYNEHLKEIAVQEQVGYLPVHERQKEYLTRTQPTGRDFESEGRLSIGLLLRHYLLRQNFDTISKKYGYVLVTDGVHMNSRGASFITEEIESFLLTNAKLCTP